MTAKGTCGWILPGTGDLDTAFEKVRAGDADVAQEPAEQPYGIRDCAFRDPAGDLTREPRPAVPAGVRRVAVHAPDEASYRAYDGAAAA
ncbi:hypothetical protein GCM10010446_59930 [Streptomyces enissocaesilis]|uniref:Uncharacterized protein n=1 Tax=Streptomyces enissocaesilis TaxID=332589 RepID=A0ABN3XPB5_9ACTN